MSVLETLATAANVHQRKLSQQVGTTGGSFITVFQQQECRKDNLDRDEAKDKQKNKPSFSSLSKEISLLQTEETELQESVKQKCEKYTCSI